MPLRLEITAPGAAPREVPLLPGRTEVVAGPGEQYRLIGDAGEIPADVRVLRVENTLVVTGLPNGQELALEDFFSACRPGTDCTLSFAGPGAPEGSVANDSPSLAALTDGSFLLYGPVEPGAAPATYGGGATGGMSPWGIGLAALLGVGVAAAAAGGGGGGGGGGGDGGTSTAVLGTGDTAPPAPAPAPGGTPAPPASPAPPAPPADTAPPVLRITDSVAAATTNGPVTFTFGFSEPVLGFDAGDVTVTGGTKGELVAADGGLTWTMAVTPAARAPSGEIVASVAAGAATDAAGNPIAAASASQGIDTLGPVVSIVDDTPAAVTNRPVTFTFSFTEPATGFTLGDLVVDNGVPGALVTLSEGLRYALTVTPFPDSPSGSIRVDVPAGGVADALGNTNPAAPTAVQDVDTVAPAQEAFVVSVFDSVPPRVGNMVLGEPTNDTTPTLTLTLDSVLGPGETLAIARDGATVGSYDSGQSFVYADAPLGPGVHTYSATVSDAAGNLRPLDLNGAAPDAGFFFVVT